MYARSRPWDNPDMVQEGKRVCFSSKKKKKTHEFGAFRQAPCKARVRKAALTIAATFD